MKLQRLLLPSAILPTCLALFACGGSDPTLPGVGGAVGVGGAATGGAVGSGGALGGATGKGGTSSGGSASTGATTSGGSSSGGGSSGGATASTGGGASTGGSINQGGAGTGGAMGKGGSGTGGKATGGGVGTGGSSSGGTSSSTGGSSTGGNAATGGATGKALENDETGCTIGTVPDSGALTAIAKLPDPFQRLDGTRIAAKADWRCRRAEIKRLAEKFAFGTKPPKPTSVTGSVSNSSISVKVTEGSKSASFSASVSLPTTGSAPYPAVVVLGGFGADTNTIRAAGAAVISYDPYLVGAETGASRANKAGAFYTMYGSNNSTGLLVAWGWGVSRIIDVIEQSDGKILRADGIGVTGCSRFGKGAFVIGAFDQRIALTMPIESGTAGVPIWRNVNAEGGQTLASAYGETYWFGDAFSAFTGGPTKNPIDTHEVIGMVAPRGLFIMDNPHIKNLGPVSAHISALAGAEIYKALGAGDNITYWSDVSDGSHCAVRSEWKDPLTKNIQKHLLKSGSFTGAMKASSKATGSLASWRDWTTPTLN